VHVEIEDIEQADQTVKQAALKSAFADNKISLAHVTRISTEVQSERKKQ
jgi:hypothetical protein